MSWQELLSYELMVFPAAAILESYRTKPTIMTEIHKIAQRKKTTVLANLPPVSLIPVVYLDLRISPRIFEKIRDDPNVIFRGLGEGDS